MPGGPEQSRIPQRRHVDDSSSSASFLFEIGAQLKDPKYLAYGQSWADRQWENPQPDGFSAETPLLDRRHVHAHHAAARGLPRHRRP